MRSVEQNEEESNTEGKRPLSTYHWERKGTPSFYRTPLHPPTPLHLPGGLRPGTQASRLESSRTCPQTSLQPTVCHTFGDDLNGEIFLPGKFRDSESDNMNKSQLEIYAKQLEKDLGTRTSFPLRVSSATNVDRSSLAHRRAPGPALASAMASRVHVHNPPQGRFNTRGVPGTGNARFHDVLDRRTQHAAESVMNMSAYPRCASTTNHDLLRTDVNCLRAEELDLRDRD